MATPTTKGFYTTLRESTHAPDRIGLDTGVAASRGVITEAP
jgi:hypothetical protein